MILWIVNDDVNTASFIKRRLDENFQNDEIEIHNTLDDAKKSGGRPDFLLFDIGMMSVNSWFDAYDVTDDLVENYGSSIIFLYSATDVWAEGYVDELREEDYPVHFISIKIDNMVKKLKQYGFGKEN